MVLLVVAISCATAVIIEFMKHRRLTLKRSADQDVVLAKLESISDRVAGLEAIVTDERYGLSRELERLERRA
jgi:hypothetical protein